MTFDVEKEHQMKEHQMHDVPSEDPSEISSRYVRASEPPVSWGGSVGGMDGF